MTAEITESPVDDIRRTSYAAALERAVEIMAATTVMPTSFNVEVSKWSPRVAEVKFYFHRDVARLGQFRAEQSLTETSQPYPDDQVYIEASAEPAGGVRVVAWTLLDADDTAVSA